MILISRWLLRRSGPRLIRKPKLGLSAAAAVRSVPSSTMPMTTSTANKIKKQESEVLEEEEEEYGKGGDNNDQRVYYDHADAFAPFRWTARESFQYMYHGGGGDGSVGQDNEGGRPWHLVQDFYSRLVQGGGGGAEDPRAALAAALFPPQHHHHQENKKNVSENFEGHKGSELEPVSSRKGRWERLTFKIVLSYHGGSFDGWQKQPGLHTVQGLVEKVLGKFVDDRKAQQLKERSLPLEGCVAVAGRTDKGVAALQQVCSFYTWRKDVNSEDIRDAIDDAAPGKLRVLSVSKVSRVFHPNFATKWRRYCYIFPLDDQEQCQSEDNTVTSIGEFDDDQMKEGSKYIGGEGNMAVCNGIKDLEGHFKPRSFSVSKVNELLRQLVGKSLSYKVFARDTKASRSVGPPTECFMFHARAAEAGLPSIDQVNDEVKVLCVELVANRFLRKMVRVLVATAIREAAAGVESDGLVRLMDASCRRATAPPAPPDGLCLVDVGYRDFKPEVCLIR